MKKLCILLLATSTLAACKKEPASLGTTQTFEVGYQQAVTVPLASGSAVQAALTELTDSRCPTGLVCITGGTITATLQLTDAATTQTARLGYDRSYVLDSVAITLNKQAYYLRLLDVSPYPSTTTSSQLRVATLRLRPR